jgi:pyruvate/2-oxoglutarate dehydrogenase complex dihydrolipoamide acyltransferase (E2) component
VRGLEGVGRYDVLPFRPERNATVDTLRWAGKRHQVVSLLEVDVTAAREAIRAHRARTGERLSFTAWVASCVAIAASEHPGVHAIRSGRRQLVQFHEVDIAIVVERAIGSDDDRQTLPMPYVVRQADQKSPSQIHAELRKAQRSRLEPGTASLEVGSSARLQSLFLRLPAWARDLLFWRWLLRSPARIKKTMGTVAVTATGMAAPGVLAWGIPKTIHPLAIGVGGIAQRGTPDGIAEMLALTVVFDHDVTDGAPVGRFVNRLNELMTQANGLDGV